MVCEFLGIVRTSTNVVHNKSLPCECFTARSACGFSKRTTSFTSCNVPGLAYPINIGSSITTIVLGGRVALSGHTTVSIFASTGLNETGRIAVSPSPGLDLTGELPEQTQKLNYSEVQYTVSCLSNDHSSSCRTGVHDSSHSVTVIHQLEALQWLQSYSTDTSCLARLLVVGIGLICPLLWSKVNPTVMPYHGSRKSIS